MQRDERSGVGTEVWAGGHVHAAVAQFVAGRGMAAVGGSVSAGGRALVEIDSGVD